MVQRRTLPMEGSVSGGRDGGDGGGCGGGAASEGEAASWVLLALFVLLACT